MSSSDRDWRRARAQLLSETCETDFAARSLAAVDYAEKHCDLARTRSRDSSSSCGSAGTPVIVSPASTIVRPRSGDSISRASAAVGHSSRTSYLLTNAQVSGLIEAALHACRIGLPLNRFVTINWESAGAESAQVSNGSFLKRARDWLRTASAESAHIWSAECGTRVGVHIHMLMHVEPTLVRRFSHRQRGWFRHAGLTLRRGVLHSKPVGRSYWLAARGHGEVYAKNLATLLRYMTKERRVPDNVTAERRGSPVAGKRCATSENIGAAARQRWSGPTIDEPGTATYTNDFDKSSLEAAIWEALEAGAALAG